MTARRTLTADKIARLLKLEANEANGYAVDLGGGLRAVQMAESSGLKFELERDGKTHALADADAAELEAISGILWDRWGAIIPDDPTDDLLTPDELKEKPGEKSDDPVEDLLTPEELKPPAEKKTADPVADLLTPDDLK